MKVRLEYIKNLEARILSKEKRMEVLKRHENVFDEMMRLRRELKELKLELKELKECL